MIQIKREALTSDPITFVASIGIYIVFVFCLTPELWFSSGAGTFPRQIIQTPGSAMHPLPSAQTCLSERVSFKSLQVALL